MVWPQYKDHNGHACTYPKTKDEALQGGLSKYLRPPESPFCPHDRCTVLYVENDQCIFCFAKKEWGRLLLQPRVYATAAHMCKRLKTDHFFTSTPCQNGAHLKAEFNDSRRGCAICKRKGSPRQEAIKRGDDKYLPDRPCSKCGKRVLRRVHDGHCDGCGESSMSLRQLAVAAGETKYLPDVPCFHCGEIALKRVDNGRCDGCYPPKGHNKMDEATRVLMENAPATVINRDTAKAMSLTAYRTGQSCGCGHQAWRYVSTRQCITCHRQRGKS